MPTFTLEAGLDEALGAKISKDAILDHLVKTLVTMRKTRIAQLTGKVGNLEGQLKARDEYVGKIETVLANRDPDLVNLLKDIRNFMQDMRNEQHANREAMQEQTQILRASHPEVTATITKE